MAATLWRAEDLVGGDVVLDFLNTVGDTGKGRRLEHLVSWDDAVAWARFTGVVDGQEISELRSGPGDALARLRAFREAAYRVLSARAAGSVPAADAVDAVEAEIREALAISRLSADGGEAVWRLAPDRAGRDLIRHRLALRSLHLLSGPELSHLRECGRCSWLFLDHGRGRGRSWCRMATCGNRAKAERFRVARGSSGGPV
ncbi:CGNR zinc finger domain-containing protein [Inquilinus sp. CA228]|uniref:CGNR zinc finger domain-containing protein n=1 Tax=Inquilinus sp. CA228 TaxID=3455609 RepID=UPI003F8D413C